MTTPKSRTAEALTDIAAAMADIQAHRGPDDQGTWCDVPSGVALGHRRLAILDLTEQGHQPILSSCGRFVLIYNGEIYNHRELRKELEQAGRRFRGHSDTETLIEAISAWGLRETISRLRGMFAFAVWSRMDKTLTLVRDRLGIKPLYYGVAGRTFLFGSELKSLKCHPDFQAEIDPSAVALQMRHNYIPAPYSIYRGVRKLPPGHLLVVPALEIDQESNGAWAQLQPEAYWSLNEVIERGRRQPFTGDYGSAVTQLETLLQEAVSLRMLADVPVGAFLSGGIDSSLIVALMQLQSSRAIKTFTIGFSEYEYDESPYARRISEHLGTDHTELCVMPSEAQNVIPLLPRMFDEPFSDMSQIPTYLVSRLARRDVKVSLSGDGGDELFGGYQRYAHIANIWRQLNLIPGRQQLSRLGQEYLARSPLQWKRNSVKYYAELLQIASPHELYSRLNRHWTPADLMSDAVLDPSSHIGYGNAVAGLEDTQLGWMALDTQTYLPDDILTKVDRASMAVSLEARVPLLDHHVVEFAWSLPKEFRFDAQEPKKLLRAVLQRHVPPELFDRPKVGFGIPIGEWLRGNLQDWAEALLAPAQLEAHGLFRSEVIRDRWAEHLSGRVNWQYPLWDVLMFQAWYAENH